MTKIKFTWDEGHVKCNYRAQGWGVKGIAFCSYSGFCGMGCNKKNCPVFGVKEICANCFKVIKAKQIIREQYAEIQDLKEQLNKKQNEKIDLLARQMDFLEEIQV